MIQDILALLTVSGAIIYMVWGIYKVVKPSKNEQNIFCGGCYASGCAVKSIKQNANRHK